MRKLTDTEIDKLRDWMASKAEVNDMDAVYNHPQLGKDCLLEVPIGELADGLKGLALVGRSPYDVRPIVKGDRFNAQGIEGKAIIRKPLYHAIINTGILDAHRWQIKQ